MRDAFLVGSGAALGALARYGLSVLLPASFWPLLLINVLGSAAMGYWAPGKFWGTGVLGGFTSFATFTLITVELSAVWALSYALATVGGCVAAWLVGDLLRRGGVKTC